MELERIAIEDSYFIEKNSIRMWISFWNHTQSYGFPTSMFTVLFAVARTTGWIAQWNEMIKDPAQRIGRPRQLYTGPKQRAFVDLAKR